MIFKKTYRLESNIQKNITPNSILEKKYVRIVDIYLLEYAEDMRLYQVFTIDFDFSDDNNAMGQLMRKLSYTFDEIELLTDSENTIIKINNLSEIKKRWNKIELQLLRDHKGDEVKNYFNSISELLDNEESFISFLSEYKMFGLLFNGLSAQHLDNKKKQRTISKGNLTIIEELVVKVQENKVNCFLHAKMNGENQYTGQFIYENSNILEGYIENLSTSNHIKYSLLWIG